MAILDVHWEIGATVGSGLVLCGLGISRGVRVAEREGFEPPIPVKVYTLSRRAPSATRPSLRAARFAPVDTRILSGAPDCRAPQCTASLPFCFSGRGKGELSKAKRKRASALFP